MGFLTPILASEGVPTLVVLETRHRCCHFRWRDGRKDGIAGWWGAKAYDYERNSAQCCGRDDFAHNDVLPGKTTETSMRRAKKTGRVYAVVDWPSETWPSGLLMLGSRNCYDALG